MQLSPPRALLLFLLLVLINGPALAGKGQVAGGGIARTIECNQNIARYLELGAAAMHRPAASRRHWRGASCWPSAGRRPPPPAGIPRPAG